MSKAPLRFRNRGEWRTWLRRHHRSAPEAVLYLSKKPVPRGLHHEEALEEALCFGWIDGELRAHDAAGFLQRFTPRRPDSVWSQSNRNRVTRLAKQRRMTAAGLEAVQAAKRSGAWQAAYRVSQPPPIPSDLRTALRVDTKAWSHFRAWGNSYRTACIRWVMDAKRASTRTRRIRRVVQRAAEDKRPGIEGF